MIEKIKKLVKEVGMDFIPFEFEEWRDGIVMFPFRNSVYLICKDEVQKHQARNYLRSIRDELEHYEIYNTYTAQEFMALLISQFNYVGFHDGMAFSIYPSKYVTWTGKPNYRAIKRAFEKCGFVWEED